MSTYPEWLVTLLPSRLSLRWGARWMGALGAGLDDLLDRTKASVEVRGVSIAPDDAVPYHGRDRSIGRLPAESLDAYRTRLVAAWETWSWAGTQRGVWQALFLVGLRGALFFTARESLWDRWCPDTLWARFRVVETGRYAWGEARWGSFQWGDLAPDRIQPLRWGHFVWGARVWGLDVTPAWVTGLLAQLAQWKNARDRVHSVAFVWGGAVWGRFVWGASTWGAAQWPVTLTHPGVWGSFRWGERAWGAPDQLV